MTYQPINYQSIIKKFKTLNLIYGLLHFVSVIILLILKYTENNGFMLPIMVNIGKYPKADCQNDCFISYISKQIFEVDLIQILAVFQFISCLAHIYAYFFYDTNMLNNEDNYIRWIEYSISSALMIVVIAGVLGINNLYSLIMLGTLMWAINVLALVQSWMPKDQYSIGVYLPSFIAWLLYFIIWLVLIYSKYNW